MESKVVATTEKSPSHVSPLQSSPNSLDVFSLNVQDPPRESSAPQDIAEETDSELANVQ